MLSPLPLIIITALMYGCASSPGPRPTSADEDMPEWAANTPAGCGMGVAKFRGDVNMARTTSVSRARADLARNLETRVQAMVKDYQSQGEDSGREFSEERITSVSRQLTEQSLVGTRVVESFLRKEEPRDFYTLVCIDAKSFGDVVQQMNSLSQAAREALKKRAEAEFTDMDTQLEKRKTLEHE